MAAAVLLVGYLAVFLWLALRPLDAVWVSPANLHPLNTIRADLAQGPQAAVYGIGGGMLGLAPLGLLLPLAVGHYRRRMLCGVRTVFVGVMISLTTEFMQSGARGHVADVDTVLLSGLGVGLTHLVCFGPMRRWARRRWMPVVALTVPREVSDGELSDPDSALPHRFGSGERSARRPAAPWVAEHVAHGRSVPGPVTAGQRQHRVGTAP